MDLSIRELLQLIPEKNTLIEQLQVFCHINSGTDNLSGLAKMSTHLEQVFSPLADSMEKIPLSPIPILDLNGESSIQHCGDALLFRKRPKNKRRILLAGHMDTVYGANSPFQNLTFLDENLINGPGVADMKGGLLVMLHALRLFEQSKQAAELGWDVFINTDEEIGSPASAPILEQLAKQYQAALVYEPAMNTQGTLAKNRRGSGKLTLVAKGKSAHAGRAFHEGRNAICYLAEIIIAVHALNDLDKGITINVGKIAGGDALNKVPNTAVAQLDVRISNPEDEYWVRKQLHTIQQQYQREGYSLTVHGHFGRPVKHVNLGTERLFARIHQAGLALGLNIDWQDSGGCCDGNNLAQYGLPVIDTLGVRGGNLHSEEEFILIDSLAERIALSTLLLLDLANGGLEELSL